VIVTGIVLAGGQSRRMGVDKALLRIDGETFLEIAASRLRPLCRQILIAAHPEQPLPEIEGCRIVTDEEPGQGPLAGLVAGIANSDDEWHLALACDFPLVSTRILGFICERVQSADAVVPRADGRLQPLVAGYSRACLEPGRRALASGQRAMTAMLDQVKVRVLEEEELRSADPELDSFMNVNTWDEYEAVRRRLLANAS
jgi:molybdopterin-guanine dinucleotide biosynthesis protein A